MRTIAAFDFDGTLTTSDSLIPFIKGLRGNKQFAWDVATCLPYFMGFSLGLITRQTTKENFLSHTLTDLSVEQISTYAESFANDKLDHYLRPLAEERLKWHLEKGHEVVLVSANLDVYLKPWAQRWGFKEAICSELVVKDNHFTGKLIGKNCWGEEKVKRFLKWSGPKEDFILWAYGDSKGDRELLRLADYPFFRHF